MNLFFKIGLLSLFFVAAPFVPSVKQKEETPSFRVALQQEITKLDPLHAIDSATISLLFLTEQGLCTWDSTGKIELGLCSSYTVSKDGKHYQFILKDLTWSDGSPITAFDFERSWKRALDPEHPTPNTPFFFVFAGAKEAFEKGLSLTQVGIHAISSHVLEVELEKPFAPFLKLLTTAPFFPYKIDPVTELPLSSGVYTITSLRPASTISLIKREGNGTSPNHIELQWVPDEMSAMQLFDAGQLDFIGLPFSRIPNDLPQPVEKKAHVKDLLATYALLVNPNSLTKQKDREKVARALQSINWNELSDLEIASNSCFIVPGTDLTNSITSSIQNKIAESEEGQTGSENKRELILLTTMGNLNRKVAQIIQQKLELSNIPVKIRLVDNKGYYSQMREGNFDLCITWFSIQYPSPFSVLGRFTKESFQRQLFPLEYPEFDRLYELALQERDESKALIHLAQAEALLLESRICIPLFTPTSTAFVSPNWSIGFSPSGFADLSQLKQYTD